MSIDYTVVFTEFVERHYIKNFKKKYKNAWNSTLTALRLEFGNFDLLFQKNIAEKIVVTPGIDICKTEFKIAGTNVSRRASGNRCIVAVNKEINTVFVLLVYHKNDIGGGNETAAWQKIIRDNYPEYTDLL